MFSLRSYGGAAATIGGKNSGWQTNSRSLLIGMEIFTSRLGLARIGRDTREKNHDSVPFDRGSQKKNWLAWANGQAFSSCSQAGSTPQLPFNRTESPKCPRAVPEGKGREDIPHDGYPGSAHGDRAKFPMRNQWEKPCDTHPSIGTARDRELPL